MNMKNAFCKVGLHWRMKINHCLFIDVVSGKEVFSATCPCGIEWMTDAPMGFPFFKVKIDEKE